MEFEKQNCGVKSVGKTVGIIVGAVVFTGIAFFVVSKAKLLCWSSKNYLYFAVAIVLALLLFSKIVRGSNGKNKIVS